jgi:undecaprenyl-diphosphatase
VTARGRLLVGAAGLVGTALVVRRETVGPREAAVFRAVNGLPGELSPPVWLVMQGGALGAVPAAAAAARAAGHPALARHLLVSGASAWALAKVAKGLAQRPRPAVLLPETRCRGREATGLGYVSGHAAVVTALAAAAAPQLGSRGRIACGLAVPAVWLARLYVGAHLPLDIVGGAALGLATDAAAALLLARRSATAPGRPGSSR